MVLFYPLLPAFSLQPSACFGPGLVCLRVHTLSQSFLLFPHFMGFDFLTATWAFIFSCLCSQILCDWREQSQLASFFSLSCSQKQSSPIPHWAHVIRH